MAFTPIPHVKPGDIASSATQNAMIDRMNTLQGQAGMIPLPVFQGCLNTPQTLTTSTWTEIVLNSVSVDTDSGHSGNHYTIPMDGWYDVWGFVGFTPNTSGVRTVMVTKNGTDSGTNGLPGTQAACNGASAVGNNFNTGHFIGHFVTGDTIHLMAWQNSGVDLNVSSDGDAICTLNAICLRLG